MNQFVVRPIKLTDVPSLSKVYLSLSEEDRKMFHPFPFELWKVLPIMIIISISPVFNEFARRAFPQLVWLPLVAHDPAANMIAGFGFVHFKKRFSNGEYLVDLGIMTVKAYRRREIGSKLMRNLITLSSQNKASIISLTVLSENNAAISLYQRFGFKFVAKVSNRWAGQSYPAYDMELGTRRQ